MLLARGNAPTGVETRISYLKTVEKNLSGLGLPFSDLDAAFEADGLTSIVDSVRGLIADHKAGGTAPGANARRSRCCSPTSSAS